MKSTRVPIFTLVLLVSVVVVMPGNPAVSASAGRSGFLRVTKECSEYNGAARFFCTITSSAIPEIKVGSKVFYGQAAGIPAGLLDSNVVLDAGDGNRAVGRCTLALSTGLGLCTFSDGTGEFAGFHARVDVSAPAYVGDDWHWRGTYEFEKDVPSPPHLRPGWSHGK